MQLVGLGSSPVDILVNVEESLLEDFGLNKGDFNQVDHNSFMGISQRVGAGDMASGGSVANTVWTMAALGSSVGLMSFVGDDVAGAHFYQDMKQKGVKMPVPVSGRQTMEVYCLITPDGERTFVCEMASSPMSSSEVDEALIQSADWLLVEGYFMVGQLDAVDQAIAFARKYGVKVALTVSAPFVLNLCFDVMAREVLAGVDLLVANDSEMDVFGEKMTGCEDEVKLQEALSKTPLLMTHSEKGATFLYGDEEYFEPSVDGVIVKDATGAGDAFLAGFLTKYIENQKDVSVALRQGHALGSVVVQQLGGRLKQVPEVA